MTTENDTPRGDKPPQGGFMRISELSERSGVPRTTIHYYLREGLLHGPVKTSRTMAYYDHSHLQRLQAIAKVKQETKLPTSALKAHLEGPAHSHTGKPDPAPDAGSVVAHDLKKQKRRKIMDAALSLFTTKGYHYTNVKEITREAGISTGTFYLYFSDKRQLFIEVVEQIFRKMRAGARVAAEKEADELKRMGMGYELFFEFFEKYGPILYQARVARIEDRGFSSESLNRAYRELLAPVMKHIQERGEIGHMRKVDPDLMAYTFAGVMLMLSARKGFDSKYNTTQILHFLMDLLFNGIMPGPGKPEPPRVSE